MELEYEIPIFGSHEIIVVIGEAQPKGWYPENGKAHPRGEDERRAEEVGWRNEQDTPESCRGL